MFACRFYNDQLIPSSLVGIGLGRIVALHHRSSTLYQILEYNRYARQYDGQRHGGQPLGHHREVAAPQTGVDQLELAALRNLRQQYECTKCSASAFSTPNDQSVGLNALDI